MNDFDPSYQSIVRSRQIENASNIQQAVESRRQISKVILSQDLSTAKLSTSPLLIDFPFKTVWVQDATDSNVTVSLVLNPINEGTLNAPMTLQRNLAISLERPVAGAYLYWSAQASKTITIYFLTDGDVRPGSLISQITGGVSIQDGTSVSSSKMDAGASASKSVTSASAVAMFPADSTRKVMTCYTDQDIWVGDSSVAVGTRGIFIAGGSRFVWKNTAALYGIAVGATATVTGNWEG